VDSAAVEESVVAVAALAGKIRRACKD